MKKVLFFLLLCMGLCGAMSGQSLILMRYYFNSDAQNLTYINLNSLDELDEDFEINVAGLQRGIHQLYIDLRNELGVWSHYDRVTVQVVGGEDMFTLNSLEYFYDNDPGFGNGIQVAISGEEFEGDIDFSVTGLDNGIHRLCYRFRDDENQWTHYNCILVQVTQGRLEELTDIEYFFDTDPGVGQGYSLDFPLQGVLDMDFNIQVPELTLGQHILYVRARDTSGQWSHYAQDTLTVCDIEIPEITVNGNLLSVQEGDYSYEWTLDGVIIPNNNSPSWQGTASGEVVVTITSEDCIASSAPVPFSYVGVNELVESQFSFYPNPVRSMVNINTSVAGELRIYSADGHLMHLMPLAPSITTLSVESWSQGIYFVHFISDTGTTVIRVLERY